MTDKELKKYLALHSEWLKDNTKGIKLDLRGLDLSGLDLRGAILRGADLRGANLRGANLRGADLSGADLSGADLRGANLSYSDLRGAILYGANLSYSDLRGADLSGANLSGANLSGAKTDKRYIQITCIGSRKGMTTYCFEDDIIWCGCNTENLNNFENTVIKTHENNPQYLKEYLEVIKLFRALK